MQYRKVYEEHQVNHMDLVNFFLTTPGFGHQLDIAFKIVPHALFVNLHNPIQWSVISRPFVGSRSV